MDAIYTPDAPHPIGPYSQAIRCGDLLFISGQLAIDPLNGQYTANDADKEMHLALKNLGAILAAASLNYRHVIKTSIFLQNMKDFPAINEVYGHYFPAEDNTPPPARETIEVAALPLGAKVEISCIASMR